MSMSSRLMCLSLMSLGLSGCGSSTPTRLIFSLGSNPVGASSLAVPASGVRAMTDPPGPPEIMSSDGMRFYLEEARVQVSYIRLELAGGLGCDDVRDQLPEGTGCVQPEDAPDTLTLSGPFSIDLATGEAWKGGALELPPGIYRRVDFVLGEGGFTAHTRLYQDEQYWNMNVTLPEGTVMSFSSPWDVTLEEGGSLRVMFVHGQWLTSLPLGACYQSGDLPRAGSELLLEAASGACQGAGEKVRDAIRTQGIVRAYSY